MPPGIDKYHSISEPNKKKIIEFVTDLKDTDLSEKTIANYEKFIVKFARYLKDKTFGSVTSQDVKLFLREVDYAISSKEMLKMGLIKFYRWFYEAKRGQPHPACVADIEFIRGKVLERKQKEETLKNGKTKLVSTDEYEKLINGTPDIELKAIIEVLNWFGCRISELLSMRIGGVTSNDVGVTITLLKSKTEPREATLATTEYYPKYLMEWVTRHPLKDDENAPVWINLQHTKKYMQVLRKDTVEQRIAVLSERVLNRHIHPHMFRHTALTRDTGNGMPWTHIATKYGLTKDSKQQRRYDHNKNKEFCDYIRRQNGFVKAPTAEEIKLQYQSELDLMKQEMKMMQEKVSKMNQIFDAEMHHRYEEQEKVDWQKAQDAEQLAYERGEL